MGLRKLIDSFRSAPYRNLFFATFAVMLVDSLMPAVAIRGLVTELTLAFVLGTALVETARSGPRRWPAVVLGVPAVIARLVAAFRADSATLSGAVLFFSSLFFAYLIWRLVADLNRPGRTTNERVFGALCAYIFIGMFFALAYAHLEYRHPGSFAVAHSAGDGVGAGEAGSLRVFYYFSFVTLTTLGYGDITPISESARSLAWIEALGGQLFLAVMVASLVGIHVAQSGRGGSKDGGGGD